MWPAGSFIAVPPLRVRQNFKTTSRAGNPWLENMATDLQETD
jgi:hypothetical protein